MGFVRNILFKNFTLYLREGYYEIILEEEGTFGFDDLDLLIKGQKSLGAQKLPVIVMCGEYSSTDTDFLTHLGQNKNNPYAKADAFVLKSVAQKLLANFYTKIVVPQRPTKFFNKRDLADKWLQQFIE